MNFSKRSQYSSLQQSEADFDSQENGIELNTFSQSTIRHPSKLIHSIIQRENSSNVSTCFVVVVSGVILSLLILSAIYIWEDSETTSILNHSCTNPIQLWFTALWIVSCINIILWFAFAVIWGELPSYLQFIYYWFQLWPWVFIFISGFQWILFDSCMTQPQPQPKSKSKIETLQFYAYLCLSLSLIKLLRLSFLLKNSFQDYSSVSLIDTTFKSLSTRFISMFIRWIFWIGPFLIMISLSLSVNLTKRASTYGYLASSFIILSSPLSQIIIFYRLSSHFHHSEQILISSNLRVQQSQFQSAILQEQEPDTERGSYPDFLDSSMPPENAENSRSYDISRPAITTSFTFYVFLVWILPYSFAIWGIISIHQTPFDPLYSAWINVIIIMLFSLPIIQHLFYPITNDLGPGAEFDITCGLQKKWIGGCWAIASICLIIVSFLR